VSASWKIGADLTVTYDVLAAGQVVLPHVTGTVVRSHGEWVLTRESFCALVAVGGVGCPS
jgi:hypothetical protein